MGKKIIVIGGGVVALFLAVILYFKADFLAGYRYNYFLVFSQELDSFGLIEVKEVGSLKYCIENNMAVAEQVYMDDSVILICAANCKKIRADVQGNWLEPICKDGETKVLNQYTADKTDVAFEDNKPNLNSENNALEVASENVTINGNSMSTEAQAEDEVASISNNQPA
jgi:hypothetical protein